MIDALARLFTATFGQPPATVTRIAADGSQRLYVRLSGPPHGTVVGAFGPDRDENRAFLSFSRAFRSIDLPVPQAMNSYLDMALEFKHFFVRKVMLVKYSYAFIALPGGYGTLDEVFEAATLVQTRKIKDFPIVLVGTEYWSPLLGVLRNTLVREGTIDDSDVRLLDITDSPREAVRLIRELALSHFGLSYGPKIRRRWYLWE